LEVKDLILREFLNMSKRILLDCDPGHDDAIAIMLATSSADIELVGVTTVAGNSLLSNTTRNALIVLDMVNRPDIPDSLAALGHRPLMVFLLRRSKQST
jgi:inosine-uridine nucleoside N-ribohydrolase